MMFLDNIGFSDTKSMSSEERSVTIELGDYIKSGDVKRYLDGIARYSERVNHIMTNAYKNNSVSQGDVRNLLDVLSIKEAQLLSVGLAQTMANAENKGDKEWVEHISASAALSGYVLLAIDKAENSMINSRTGYAIFDKAKSFPSFKSTNIYTEIVTKDIDLQVKIQIFLINAMMIVSFLGGLFFLLWVFSFSNMFRAERCL
ncbi:hypothetical protein [Xenorhabdus sp. KJ12.1]|uniref:hypothetical protein n=1 Tax=Xenorhabdus sp. KJ12.1 TaxID=1851571 RepID=UPI000C0610F8|nr:hypothetical protein [Xenorhabdus sp. KJ12.1]PHM72375.1 hypothetical protein Xekj_00654 [Xenorhabdus sp. KJ12.1]